MPSRSFGILIAPWLPCLALMLPLSPFHTANAIVAGLLATALAAFSLASDRARLGASLVGVWVAFTPMVVRSTLTEIVVSVSWGVTMFVCLSGPFSQSPQVTRTRAAVPRLEEDEKAHDEELTAAA